MGVSKPPFDVSVVNGLGQVVVFLYGEIDVAAEKEVSGALAGARETGAEVIVDLSQVTFIDSSGINILVRAHSETPEERFRLVGASKGVRRVFEIAHVDSVLMDDQGRCRARGR